MQNGEIKDVLDYWFSDSDLDSPTVDSRMDRWFGSSEELDNEIGERFGEARRQDEDVALHVARRQTCSRVGEAAGADAAADVGGRFAALVCGGAHAADDTAAPDHGL